MRKWGLVITLFYALIILVLLFPAKVLLIGDYSGGSGFHDRLREAYAAWTTWTFVGILVGGQALLLFLKVDTSFKKLKARNHILVSCAITALLLALLTFAGAASLRMSFRDDVFGFLDRASYEAALGWIFGTCALLWLIWGVVFYRTSRGSGDPSARAAAWMLRGSVLELLIAVPAQPVGQRRTPPAISGRFTVV